MTDGKPERRVKRPERRVRVPEKSNENFEKTAKAFSAKKEETKLDLAKKMTKVLIGIIITNVVTTTLVTFLTGFKIFGFVLPLENYISYLASAIAIIGITAFITRLLDIPVKKPQ